MPFCFKNICSNLLPAGTYKVIIESVDFRTGIGGAKTKDLQIRGVISGGTCDRRSFSDIINEKAFNFRLQPFVTAIGMDMSREFTTETEMFTYLFKQAKGKVVMATVEIKTYNGKEYNNVKDYTSLPSSTVSAKDVVDDFDIPVESTLNTPASKIDPATNDFPTVSATEDTDEDIPF